jgi:hypothetical protein
VNLVTLLAEFVYRVEQGLFVAKQAQDVFLGHSVRWQGLLESSIELMGALGMGMGLA